MMARQREMAIKNHNTELKHTHIKLAVLIRHSLKYKNQLRSSEISKGGKEARLKEEGGGGGRGGRKGWPYRHLLPSTDTQALWDFTLGL